MWMPGTWLPMQAPLTALAFLAPMAKPEQAIGPLSHLSRQP
jgi:hypothetical protein